MREAEAEEAKAAKAASQFKPGECPNPAGRGGKQVRLESDEPVPEEPARDHKAENARSTAGKIATATGVSRDRVKS